MVKHYSNLVVIGFIFISSYFNPYFTEAAPKEQLVYVQVKESRLRSKPEFWAPAVADLSYGTALASLSAVPSDKSWLKVKFADKEGFVPLSIVTKRKIVLSSSTQGVQTSVDQSSIVMAGKGFNRQVENSYAAKRGLDFKSVDLMEQNKVDSAQQLAFIQEGQLN